MARPRIKIDEQQFKNLCNMQCTLVEIAGFFNCSEDTIERWCKRELKMGFADAFKRYSMNGRISLRREQFRVAQNGNVSMLIWLGKQYLGQKEQAEVSLDTSVDESVKEMEKYFASRKNRDI